MQEILPPYYDEVGIKRRRLRRYSLLIGLLLFCFFYGFAFALFAPYLMVAFAIPLVIVTGLIIWALPDVQHPPLKLMDLLFFGFIVTIFAWPNYLALALPGLPWITVARFFSAPLAITLLVCLSVSQTFRSNLKAIFSAAPVIPIALGLFVLYQALSIALSNKPSYSINQFLNDQTSWTVIYVCSAFLFIKPGRAERWASLMWGLVVFLCLIGLIEHKLGHVPWAGHIPSFLKMDTFVDNVVAGSTRITTGDHRVAAIFYNGLTFSEFLALTAPIVMHFASTERPRWIRVAAAATIPLMLVLVLLTQSRSGALGIGLASLLYVLAWAVMKRRRDGGLIPTAIVAAYPALFAVAVASSVFIGKIRHKVWGGGEHTSSNQARVDQYARGIPMVLTHPFGHGIGRGGEALGFYLPNGVLTIDTFYLEIALDYGIVGFLIYYTIIYSGIFYAARSSLRSDRERETSLVIAAGLMLVNFSVINSVFSEQYNHPLVFAALGLVSALVYRIRLKAPAHSEGDAPTLAASDQASATIRVRTDISATGNVS
jgi:O-Antigen ligase